VTPDEPARSRRAPLGPRLLDDTDLPIADVAFAAGFGSRLVADGGLALRLALAPPPLEWEAMLRYFAARAIAGVEHVSGGTYRRTVAIDGDPGVLELSPGGPDHLLLRAHLPHPEGLSHVARRARQVFNLDAPLAAASRHLAPDPILGPLLGLRPGLRPPGTWDPFETGVRAIAGQQVSVAGASTLTARIVARHGTPVPGLRALGLTHLFPSPAALAGADLSGLGLTTARAAAINAFARAVAEGTVQLDGSSPLDPLTASIAALPGLGPWTAHYLALRLGESDAFPATDVGIRRALGGPDGRPATAREAEERARAWRPWRAHAAVHLWFADQPGPRTAAASRRGATSR
jgi:AraC family transcriptional regulator, regulatory protein of adaptative response / DNA-3-methyladenine glycosylase II